MNRYSVNKEVFMKNHEIILASVKNIVGDQQKVHLIVDGISDKDLQFIYSLPNSNPSVIIYNSIVDLVGDEKSVNIGTYINSISDIDEVNQDLIDLMYLQRIDGYSGVTPFKNSLCVIDENLNVSTGSYNIGNLITGLEFELWQYKNKFLGLNGACKKCLNALCEHNRINNEVKGLLLVEVEHCKSMQRLISKVSKEVREVSREQYNTLIEMMFEVFRNSDVSTAMLMDFLEKTNNKEEK